MIQYIELSELTQTIERGIKQSLPDEYWVVAEISECVVNSKGHCYMELIEKPADSMHVIAKARATIWAYQFRMLQAYFSASTGIDFQPGIKILCKVQVEFHAVYGLSLNITDVDPVYTIGEEEKQRREIIVRLQQEGIADMNKELSLPRLIQRIAVISSSTAAGYQDFMHHMLHNTYACKFHIELFPAIMQGSELQNSVVAALDAIYVREMEFDVVVIIRGGGAKTDLRWFDNYTVAAHIAQFPLPVLVGIGHDKDMSIVDMVAHTSVKTPTAVADFLIQYAYEELRVVEDLYNRLTHIAVDRLAFEKESMLEASRRILQVYTNTMYQMNSLLIKKTESLNTKALLCIAKEHSRIMQANYALESSCKYRVQSTDYKLQSYIRTLLPSVNTMLFAAKKQLELSETKLTLYNPLAILDKGYSITRNAQGMVIRNASQTHKGEQITTLFAEGTITSTVDS